MSSCLIGVHEGLKNLQQIHDSGVGYTNLSKFGTGKKLLKNPSFHILFVGLDQASM